MWSDGARQLQVLDEMSHDPQSKLRPWLGKISWSCLKASSRWDSRSRSSHITTQTAPVVRSIRLNRPVTPLAPQSENGPGQGQHRYAHPSGPSRSDIVMTHALCDGPMELQAVGRRSARIVW